MKRRDNEVYGSLLTISIFLKLFCHFLSCHVPAFRSSGFLPLTYILLLLFNLVGIMFYGDVQLYILILELNTIETKKMC